MVDVSSGEGLVCGNQGFGDGNIRSLWVDIILSNVTDLCSFAIEVPYVTLRCSAMGKFLIMPQRQAQERTTTARKSSLKVSMA